MKISRKLVVVAAILLLVIPAIGFWALLHAGLVGLPGKPVAPPFNMSDQIATIDVVEGEDGELRGRFAGWKEGDTEMTGEEFFQEIHGRNGDLPTFYRLLTVTSLAGVAWVVFGFLGQAVFMGRMVVQIIASEKAKSSVVPPAFWWLSLLGASMLMIYFIWRKDPVGFLGQSTGWVIYLRNIWLIYGRKKTL